VDPSARAASTTPAGELKPAESREFATTLLLNGTRPGEHFSESDHPADAMWTLTQSFQNPATQVAGKFHGSHVSGLVGAATNNVEGVSGAGYNTPVIPIKIDFDSPSIVQDVAEALNFAISQHPAAINMSFGGTGFNPSWADAAAAARAQGIVPVASAANDQQQRPGFTFYPAAFPGVVAVGATTPSDQIAVVVDSRARTKVRLTTLASLRVKHNKLFLVKGTVSPHIAGLTVRVQVRRSGASSYRTVKSTKSRSGGKVSVRIKI
jgi:Subtilase family